MLPAAARLRRRADFVATVRGGRRRGHGAVVVHLNLPASAGTRPVPAPPAGESRGLAPAADAPTRVGFVVSRAVGGAVARNRVRRRLQHLVRERFDRIPPGATLVVRALPGAAERSYAELSGDFDAALSGVLHGRSRRGRRPRGSPRGAGSVAPGSLAESVGVADDHRAAADGRDRAQPQAGSGAARALAVPIVAYRRWVSPVLPARCRFHPSCSAYALQALQTHGALRGVLLTVLRLLRCHPFHPGGYDPVPPAPRRRPRITVTGASRCWTG